MTEQELRALVRQAIARHAADPRTVAPSHAALPHVGVHASHAMFAMPDGAEAEGPCLIEPAVPCNHCGYCKSMGH